MIRGTIIAPRCGVCLLVAAAALGAVCSAAGGAVELLGAQYQEDDWFPEYNCIWKDRDYPTSCTVSTAVGCNIHAYLKNTGTSSATVTSVQLAGYDLETVLLLNEGVHDARSIYFYWDFPPQNILDAGEPVWYKVDPSKTIPPGGVAQVIVRLRHVPVTNPIPLTVVTSGGTLVPNLAPDANTPVLASVGFSQDRKKVYLHWRRSGGAAPTTIKMDGVDVTANATTVGDPNTNFAVSVLSFPTALEKMSYHVYQGIYADGKTATGALRTWVNKFMHGTYNTFDVESSPSYTIEDWIEESSNHGINNVQVSVGNVVNYMNTPAGSADCIAREYGYTSGDKTKFDTRNLGPDMFFINDEVDAEDANMERTFCGTGKKLPCGQSSAGILAMRTIGEGEALRALRPNTPTSVNMDGAFKPENYYSYGQAVDILQVDPYYQRRLQDVYWRDQNAIPVYLKATYIYAVAKAVARAAEPNPSNVILYSCSWRCMNENACDPEYLNQTWPFADPETKRIEAYYALAAGTKGLCYWWFNIGWPSMGLANQTTQAARDLWREMGLYGNEIKTVRDQLVVSHPVDLAMTPSANVWARALASGTDTLILLVVNDDYYNDTAGFHHNVVNNASVTVTLPNWMLSSPTAFEVSASGVSSVNTSLSGGNLTVNLGTLDITRMVFITVDPKLMMTLRQRYDSNIWSAVCTFAPTVCNQNTSAPSFVRHPSPQSALAGGTVGFTIAANGGSPFSYQWQKNGANLANGGHYSGANTPFLTISSIDSNDVANYRCVATNPYGSATSNAAALTISTVTFSQHPAAQSTCPGSNAQFSVAATGQGTLGYRWQKNQINLSNGGHYSGVTTSTLTITGADGNDVANYRCAVTDSTSTAYSNEAALTLADATSITQQPSNQLAELGGTATFSVAATGGGVFTYQWQKNQSNLSNGGHYSGVATATLTISNVDAGDEAAYRCMVTSECGSATSNEATLTVNTCPPYTAFQNGDFENWPSGLIAANWTGAYSEAVAGQFVKSNTIIRPGSTLSQGVKARDAMNAWAHVYQGFDTNVGDAITVIAYAYPTATSSGVNPQVGVNTTSARPSSWLYILNNFTKNTWSTIGPLAFNATGTTTYLFLDVKRVGAVDTTTYWDDVSLYRAHVPPAPTVGGPTSTTLNVDVDPGCNATNGDAQYAITIGGGAYTLGTHWVQVNGTVGTTAAWQTDETWANKTVTGLVTGITYTFKVKARYNGTYTQETSLGAGAPGTPGGGSAVPPTVTQHPSAQSVCAGATAHFSVAATGDAPLGYQWQKNQANLSNGGHYAGANTATLTVSGADGNDVANYRCVVTNGAGSATSNAAGLTLKAATTIAQHPQAQSIPAGGTATFTVAATGDGTLGYQWQKNSANLANGGHYAGVTTATLTVSNADGNDAANYRCVVTGGCGSATSNQAALSVGAAPVPGDFDHDGDVDMADFAHLQGCLDNQSAPPANPNCADADLDHDAFGAVTRDDVVIFVQCMTGPEIPGDPNCAN